MLALWALMAWLVVMPYPRVAAAGSWFSEATWLKLAGVDWIWL